MTALNPAPRSEQHEPVYECRCGNHAYGFSCEQHGPIDQCPIHGGRTRDELIALRSEKGGAYGR